MVDTPRQVRLEAALADLRMQCPEVEAASVVSYDGLPMAASLPPGMDEERVAAMCAALLSLGERASEGLGRGTLEHVSIDGDTGSVHLVSAEDEAVLVVVASPEAKAGLVLFEMRRIASEIAEILGTVRTPEPAVSDGLSFLPGAGGLAMAPGPLSSVGMPPPPALPDSGAPVQWAPAQSWG